jgi:hypothetical protein
VTFSQMHVRSAKNEFFEQIMSYPCPVFMAKTLRILIYMYCGGHIPDSVQILRGSGTPNHQQNLKYRNWGEFYLVVMLGRQEGETYTGWLESKDGQYQATYIFTRNPICPPQDIPTWTWIYLIKF